MSNDAGEGSELAGGPAQTVDAADAWDIFRVRQVVWDALASSSLDIFYSNVNVQRALYRIVNQPEWEAHHVLYRRDVEGKVNTIPFSKVSRSWFTREGRFHIRGALYERSKRLAGIAEGSSEKPKLLTLTIADAQASWDGGQGALRAFLNRLVGYFRRRGYKVSYLWVVEMQARLALHYHVLLVGAPFINRELIARWWPLGSVFDVRAVTAEKGLGYILKYVRKTTRGEGEGVIVQQVLHSAFKVKRYGSSRDVSTKAEKAPQWVRVNAHILLADVVAMQAARVLLKRPLPRDRHGEHQGIQRRVTRHPARFSLPFAMESRVRPAAT